MVFSKSQSPIRFHISLNVSDIPRSVNFFKTLFGAEPAKHRSDYAKFELENPPLTLSLEPISPQERGSLNHLGFRLNNVEELVALQRSLEMAGISSKREEGVECCYAKQSKFWLHDPDQNLWEMYILEGDLVHRGAGQAADTVLGEHQKPAADQTGGTPIMCSQSQSHAETQQWVHRLGSPLAIPVEYASESLDAIALQGTFNAEGTDAEIKPFLDQVVNRLKSGGELTIHCPDRRTALSQSHFNFLDLRTVVKSVPCLETLLEHLESAGFEHVFLEQIWIACLFYCRRCGTQRDFDQSE